MLWDGQRLSDNAQQCSWYKCSYRDKIVKQSCYFAKLCDREFNIKHIGVNLFSLQLGCTWIVKILFEIGRIFVSRCWGYFMQISGRKREVLISRENRWFCNKIWISHVFLNFHIIFLCRVLQQIKIFYIKGDSNPNDKYVLSERALWTMNFDSSFIKIGWKMGQLWTFKEFNMANIL